jgi:hypothetical protein
VAVVAVATVQVTYQVLVAQTERPVQVAVQHLS